MEVHRLGEKDVADDERLTRFLLGDMPDEERERLQDACFEDEALFARLLRAEDDLIDAYVRGDLTAAERARFEQRFGQTPAQARRVRFARLLRRAEERRAGADVRRSRSWRLAAVAAGLLAVVAGVWWWAGRGTEPQVVSRPSEPTASPAAVGPSPSAVPTERGPVPEPARPPIAVASLTLSPGMARGSGAAPRLVLSPTTTSVELHLDLGPGTAAGAYRRYEVIVQSAAGAEVFRRGVPRGSTGDSARLISVSLPTRGLTIGDYVVLVNGRQADGTEDYLRGYSFRIVR